MTTRGAPGASPQDADEEQAPAREPEAAPSNPADVAEYVAEYTKGLARLARSSKLDVLAYLLDVAHLEARTVLASPVPKRGKG